MLAVVLSLPIEGVDFLYDIWAGLRCPCSSRGSTLATVTKLLRISS